MAKKLIILLVLFAIIISHLNSSYATTKTIKLHRNRREVIAVRRQSNGMAMIQKEIDFPNDTGANFGDMIYSNGREESDLLVRELLINDEIYDHNVRVTFINVTIEGFSLTCVRAINLGRERAFVEQIIMDNAGSINIVGLIKKRQQIRLLVEIYGQPRV